MAGMDRQNPVLARPARLERCCGGGTDCHHAPVRPHLLFCNMSSRHHAGHRFVPARPHKEEPLQVFAGKERAALHGVSCLRGIARRRNRRHRVASRALQQLRTHSLKPFPTFMAIWQQRACSHRRTRGQLCFLFRGRVDEGPADIYHRLDDVHHHCRSCLAQRPYIL